MSASVRYSIASNPRVAESAERFYLPELDVLRFFAFLGVFADHIGSRLYAMGSLSDPTLHTVFRAGGFGVDLFFALSSYLITSLLLRERAQTGTVDMRSFLARRILRIWPLYFFFLGFAFVLSTISAPFAVRPAYFVAFAFFVGNFAMGSLGPLNILIYPLWSVSVEEQFYLSWPWAVRKMRARALAMCAIGLLIAATLARLILSIRGNFGKPVWYNTFSRLDPIAVGILLAMVPGERLRAALGRGARIAVIFAAVITFALVSYYCPIFEPTITTRQQLCAYPIAALACAALLVAVIGIGHTDITSGPVRALAWLGKISYGLYVYHGLAIALAEMICFPPNRRTARAREALMGPFALLALALTVLVAAASYRILEAPFLRLKSRFTLVASRPV